MLAGWGRGGTRVGGLRRDVHPPMEWRENLMRYLATELLPAWRDDPRRTRETGETRLTAQLCSYLNEATRRSNWDWIQFKREEPDETDARRSLDLVVAPVGATVWLEGRDHDCYRTLLPIECKRLPTPRDASRDEREYLHGKKTAGGVQRFKENHHAAAHQEAAMIAYLQERDIPFWLQQVDQWVSGLAADGVTGWSDKDRIALTNHDQHNRVASLRSTHARTGGGAPILVHHLWIELWDRAS